MLQLIPDNEGDIFLLNVHNLSLPHTTTCTRRPEISGITAGRC